MPLGKLIKIVREVIVYKKTNSNTYGKEIEEINVDAIPIEILKSIITPNNDDPLLYDGYILTSSQVDKLNTHMETKINPNHEEFEYALKCYGIYDKSNEA